MTVDNCALPLVGLPFHHLHIAALHREDSLRKRVKSHAMPWRAVVVMLMFIAVILSASVETLLALAHFA